MVMVTFHKRFLVKNGVNLCLKVDFEGQLKKAKKIDEKYVVN